MKGEMVKRTSQDGTMAIVYLFDDVALSRSKGKINSFTLMSEEIFYELVSARWLNKPTIVSVTGDEIRKYYIDAIITLNYDLAQKLVYGTAETSAMNGCEFEYYVLFFVFQYEKVSWFLDEKSFHAFLQEHGLQAEELREPDTFF